MYTLYYMKGACPLAPHVLLEELGVEHRLEAVSPKAGDTRTPEFLAMNPFAQVPVLKLPNGETITQVTAICEYIAANYGQGTWMPEDPFAQVRVRETLSQIATALHPAFGLIFVSRRFAKTEEAQEQVNASGRKMFRAGLQVMEDKLGEDGYICGAEPTIADAYLIVMFLWSGFVKIDLSDLPKFRNWAGRMMARPAVQRALKAQGLAPS